MIDKIFKPYDVRGVYPMPLNEENAWKVGHAIAQFLKRSRDKLTAGLKVKNENTMVVGRDMRPSSPDLSRSLIDGLRSVGMNVVDVGMIDTSFIYFAINELDAVGGVQVTASDYPVQYNGFKINGPRAKPIGAASGLDDIKRIALGLRIGQTGVKGRLEETDLWPRYKATVRKFLNLHRKLRVMVDASNGMAGKMVPAVFGDIANLEIIPVLFDVTGNFVHEPNPLVEANLDVLKQKMAGQPCDLGVCFDGDGDRCVFLDEHGEYIGSDIITAMLAKDFLEDSENAGATVVYDVRSSWAVADVVVAAGGVPKRDRVGHSFIKKTMTETNAIFGGELSGHYYFRDYFHCDSAAAAFARVLSVLSAQDKPMSELVQPFHPYSQSGEISFRVEEKEAKIRELAEGYKKGKSDYLDGITVDMGEWWFNVRKSSIEPMLRLNMEAKSPELLEEKLRELKKILGEPSHGRQM